jgi:hypothetical protein
MAPIDIDVCESPIFIIGSPRSGTTALAWALNEHPDLAASDESQILVDLFAAGNLDRNYEREGNASWLRKQGIERDEFLADVGLGFNHLFTKAAGGKRWIDQTPYHTVMVGWLAGMFPGAKFLHILRDGRRVVHPMINYGARFGGKAPGAPWSASFQTACETWVRFTRTAMEFQSEHPDRCLTIRNEDLVRDPETGFRRIFAFLEVPDHPEAARFFASKRINSSFGPPGKRIGAADTLTEPWGEWGVSRKQAFVDLAGPTMEAYGLAAPGEPALTEWEQEAVAVRRILRDVVPEDARVLVAGTGGPPEVVAGRRAWEVSPLRTPGGRVPDLAETAAAGADHLAVVGPLVREAGGPDVLARRFAGATVLHAGEHALVVRIPG